METTNGCSLSPNGVHRVEQLISACHEIDKNTQAKSKLPSLSWDEKYEVLKYICDFFALRKQIIRMHLRANLAAVRLYLTGTGRGTGRGHGGGCTGRGTAGICTRIRNVSEPQNNVNLQHNYGPPQGITKPAAHTSRATPSDWHGERHGENLDKSPPKNSSHLIHRHKDRNCTMKTTVTGMPM